MNRLKIEKTFGWSHQRSGWGLVSKAMRRFHNPLGTLFVDWADGEFRNRRIFDEQWVGFIHNPITYPTSDYPSKYQSGLMPLERLIKTEIWQNNLGRCLGIYTLSRHTANFLSQFVKTQPTFHPTETPRSLFDWDKFEANPHKQILHIGQWMRKYHSFCILKSPYAKTLLVAGNYWNKDVKQMCKYADCSGLKVLSHVKNSKYDELLSSNTVFLDLYDAGACNTILECIVRNTPIVINRLPSNEEYLGDNYPGFYSTLKEAEMIVSSKLKECHEYLLSLDKSRFSIFNFIESIENGPIYQSLPIPSISML